MRKRRPDHPSSVHPGLDRKPGKSNWVDGAGGLPKYVERIAKHIHSDSGLSISHAIASAVNRVKELAAKGNKEAIKALAEWEAKKGKSKKRNLAVALTNKRGERFEEHKHPRADMTGKFIAKVAPSELIDARKTVEGILSKVQVGQTVHLPDKLGWVRRSEDGWFIQGPQGYSTTVQTLSSAIEASAIILAGKQKSRMADQFGNQRLG